MLSRKSNAALKRLLVSDYTSPNVSQSSPKSLNCAIRSLAARHIRQDHHCHFIQPPKKQPGKNSTQRGLLGLERDDVPFQKVRESGARSRQAPLPSERGRKGPADTLWAPGRLPGTVPVRQVSSRSRQWALRCGSLTSLVPHLLAPFLPSPPFKFLSIWFLTMHRLRSDGADGNPRNKTEPKRLPSQLTDPGTHRRPEPLAWHSPAGTPAGQDNH